MLALIQLHKGCYMYLFTDIKGNYTYKSIHTILHIDRYMNSNRRTKHTHHIQTHNYIQNNNTHIYTHMFRHAHINTHIHKVTQTPQAANFPDWSYSIHTQFHSCSASLIFTLSKQFSFRSVIFDFPIFLFIP